MVSWRTGVFCDGVAGSMCSHRAASITNLAHKGCMLRSFVSFVSVSHTYPRVPCKMMKEINTAGLAALALVRYGTYKVREAKKSGGTLFVCDILIAASGMTPGACAASGARSLLRKVRA